MITCQMCPKDDNQVPNEMYLEHVQLMHREVSINTMHIEAPENATEEEVERWGPSVLQAMKPLIERIGDLEKKAFGAFTAGYKDGHEDALRRAAECLRSRAKQETEPLLELGMRRCADHLITHTDENHIDLPGMISANDVLLIMNQGNPIDYSAFQIHVATAPAPMSVDVATQTTNDTETWWPFEQGEIVVTDSEGREPFGQERHIHKHGVTFEKMSSLHEAIARRAQICPND